MTSATDTNRFSTRGILAQLLILIPILSLAVSAIAWLRYGVDLPTYDDWRAYNTGQALSLNPRYLLKPAHETLYPVGKVLDVVAQRFLDGNSVAYQFLSMVTVLGALLWLQWRLLEIALQDRLLAASAFSLTVFMLQPGSYWGIQNFAYHQALPLVFLLAALLLILATQWPRQWLVPAVTLLGVLSGMTYISGAFAALVAGAVLLALAASVRRDEREQLIWGGGALLAAGIVTSAIQYGASVKADVPLAFPTESRFWFFLLGNVARGAALHNLPTGTAYPLTLLVVAAVAGALAALLWRTATNAPNSLLRMKTAIVYTVLVAVVFAFLVMISAGRAKMLGPDVESSLRSFARALTSSRIYFFWPTLLWPWLAAALYCLLKPADKEVSSRLAIVAVLVPALLLPTAAAAGVFRHFGYQKYRSHQQLAAANCFKEHLRAGVGIRCRRVIGFDLAGAYANGLQFGASFIGTIPLEPIGIAKGPAIYRLSSAPAGSWKADYVAKVERDAGRVTLRPKGGNPTLLLRMPTSDVPHDCVVMEAGLRSSARPELSFQRPEETSFEKARRQRPVASPGGKKGMQDYVFQMGSSRGFSTDFRVEFASGGKPVRIEELELRCRLRKSAK